MLPESRVSEDLRSLGVTLVLTFSLLIKHDDIRVRGGVVVSPPGTSPLSRD